jgi:hypothetical protein
MLKRCKRCDGLVELVQLDGDVCLACKELEYKVYTHAIKHEGSDEPAIFRSTYNNDTFTMIMGEYADFVATAGDDVPDFVGWANKAGYDVEYVEVIWHYV